ncbi:hypothetical protein V6N11_053950 [Hibiscus sabdariffa]|uniref:Uncharacterized protein n=1 Tax=Hibiscus sabdariffa TaxID=183260 RepID=A0ABR2S2D6_9ROSI
MAAIAAPVKGPSQKTQWLVQVQLTTAGPYDTAGFIEAPSKEPPATMLALTMKPITIGAIIPTAHFFGSIAVVYTVYTSPNIMTISKTTMFHADTPKDSAKADVSCSWIKTTKSKH